MSWAEAELMLGVLDALAAAHEMDIVHRDLKPSNILLGRDGRARVMDFGIAARMATPDRRRIGAPADAGDGRIMGTPGYISPEAARGEAPVPAMDVFAAGVLLGERLAGAPLMRETVEAAAEDNTAGEGRTPWLTPTWPRSKASSRSARPCSASRLACRRSVVFRDRTTWVRPSRPSLRSTGTITRSHQTLPRWNSPGSFAIARISLVSQQK